MDYRCVIINRKFEWKGEFSKGFWEISHFMNHICDVLLGEELGLRFSLHCNPKIYKVIKAMPVPLKWLEICCTVPSLSKLSIQYIEFSDWKISKFIRMTLVKDFFPLIRLKGIISLKILNWFRTPKIALHLFFLSFSFFQFCIFLKIFYIFIFNT